MIKKTSGQLGAIMHVHTAHMIGEHTNGDMNSMEYSSFSLPMTAKIHAHIALNLNRQIEVPASLQLDLLRFLKAAAKAHTLLCSSCSRCTRAKGVGE